MATIATSSADRTSAERKFYSRMALFMLVMVFIGFAPSFYLRGYVFSPRPNPTLPPAVMLHGVLFSLWMLAFVAQTQLVAAGRRDIHMKLGVTSFILALAMLPLMYLVGVWQVARANQPPFTTALDWTIVPLALIPPYAILLFEGWTWRRQAAWHKRAMLCAGLLFMDPAIGRLPIVPPVLGGFAVLNFLSIACFVPLILWDRRTLGKLHPATRLGISLAIMMHAVRLTFLATGAWAPVAAHLPGVTS
ncbi:hypothetical protein HMF7854_08660 [Sphingomonas ginkgonis]|uniref:DUF2306 domain-containing protein n=1 Tax=Sphingomonas ginkgonis TaxID=2315330 RepID=A0A3R9YIW4_9SPHN|nr:hypothetical protein [Sphingomonas ginkgonis]RST30903.1 hypothetical protein HMF7854_08660 [Sphingomonas ginkgonis]